MRNLSAGPDPAKRESTDHYRTVVVPELRMTMRLDDGTKLQLVARYEFSMVRGDAAVLPNGTAPNPRLWYVRACREITPDAARTVTVTRALAPAFRDTAHDASAASDTSAAAPGPLAILRLPNPARGSIALEFRLPAPGPVGLEVFDVAGRRVLRRVLPGRQAGLQRASLGDASVAPGTYWLRLSQGQQRVTGKVVLIR